MSTSVRKHKFCAITHVRQQKHPESKSYLDTLEQLLCLSDTPSMVGITAASSCVSHSAVTGDSG